ncbi:MAG: DUF1501 domain-containing protein [Chloroflexota bacterium]
MNRRQFLQSSASVGILGASKNLFPKWMPRMAFRAPEQGGPPGDVLICIFLRGGMDGLSAVVPFGEGANYYDNRPTLAVAEPGSGEGSAINLDNFFGLHPALAPLKEVYEEQDLTIVHATGLTDSTRSHFDAMRFMEHGTPGEKKIGTGWIGRHLQTAAWQNDSPFRAIGMGAMVPTSLRGPISPLSLQSIADFHFKGREDEMARMRQSLMSLYTVEAPQELLSKQASLVFNTVDILQNLSAQPYQPAHGAEYPYGEFGMAMSQVAQLIKANVGLEVACIDLGGWDTHENQGTIDGEFNALMTTLGAGLHALYTDLGEQMKQTSVVAMSEFGRTTVENGSQGTDHGHGNVMFLMGGGMKGGQVYADWPTLQPEFLSDGDLAITTDYRDVLAEVISGRLGNPALDQIFPNHTPTSLGIVEKI